MQSVSEHATTSKSGGSKVVLVVDDSTFIRNRVRDALQAGGYEVAQAGSGLQALEQIENAPPGQPRSAASSPIW